MWKTLNGRVNHFFFFLGICDIRCWLQLWPMGLYAQKLVFPSMNLAWAVENSSHTEPYAPDFWRTDIYVSACSSKKYVQTVSKRIQRKYTSEKIPCSLWLHCWGKLSVLLCRLEVQQCTPKKMPDLLPSTPSTAVSSGIKLSPITSVSSAQPMSYRHTKLHIWLWMSYFGNVAIKGTSLVLLSAPPRSRQQWEFKHWAHQQPGHCESLSWHFCYVCSSFLTVPCVILTIGRCTSLSNQTPALPSWRWVWEDLDQSKCVRVSFPCQNFTAGRVCAQGWETAKPIRDRDGWGEQEAADGWQGLEEDGADYRLCRHRGLKTVTSSTLMPLRGKGI